MKKILILGGTAEAVSFAKTLQEETGLSVIYSLAGRTRSPNLPDCEVRQGGFGGVAGLVRYLRQKEIAAVIDATHPYAAQMAESARQAATETSLPHYKFLRPAWPEPDDALWIHASSAEDAAGKIQDNFERVFLSSGLNDIAAFSHLASIWFLIRSIEDPETPIPLGNFSHIKARGPFNEADERALLRDHKIDAVVSKNSGGSATVAKLRAAKSLSIPVIMIDRPSVGGGVLFEDPAALLEQLQREI